MHLATFASHVAHRLNWPGDQVLRLFLSAKDPTIASYAQALSHYAHAHGASLAPLLAAGQCEAPPQRQPTALRKQTTRSSFVTIKHAPLLPLVLARQIPTLDAAALSYLPTLAHDEQRQTIHEAFGPRPTLTHIVSTPFGRIGMFLLPIEAHLLYEHREHLLNLACEATYLAQSAGAITVALTGLIPSALGYGHDLAKRLHDDREQTAAMYQELSQPASQCPPLPPTVTTGHAITASAVVMNVARLLEEAGRYLSQERVAFLGLGSIGQASLRLLLEVLPHPKELILCDLYQRNLSALERELRQIGYQGKLHMALGEPGHVPSQVYDASLIIGATNVGDILDVDRLTPGALLIDDSGPHIFDVSRLLQRIHVHGDILATEAGELTVPQPMHEIRYIPTVPSRTTSQTKAHPSMEGISLSDPSTLDTSDVQSWVERLLHAEEAIGLRDTTAREAMGCLLAGALTQALHTPLTLGLVTADIAKAHYTALVQAGCRGAAPHLTNEYRSSAASLKEFRSRFGNIHQDDHASSEKRSA
ncbi:hypothetical protein [Ktedonospora formicarum]|uniref:Uncharacterized protein n=1 Tax=Ktedonospora formicarum TaxID=2778364 RepID=A0A8J3I856_9CHLR|nr:hypothetical protein [Ktedonospora formicarum]GHO49231.1 hypothetical protein KSX_73940 [Ktedonospora formicarum]